MPEESHQSPPLDLSTPEVEKVFVLGYGNSLRGDDAIGVLVAQNVRKALENRQDPRLKSGILEIRQASRLDLGMAEDMIGYSKVVIVDSVIDGGTEDVRIVDLSAIEDTPSVSSHTSSPLDLAALLSTVYRHNPRFYIVAVSGEEVAGGQSLSVRARRSVAKATVELLRLIDSLCP